MDTHPKPDSRDHGPSRHCVQYDLHMKKFLLGLLILTVTFGLGIVAYRAMTVEVPIADQA